MLRICLTSTSAMPLLRRHTVFYSCQNALKWTLTFTDSTSRLARWRIQLSKFDCDVVHRTDMKRQATDVLSRLQTSTEDDTRLEDDFSLRAVDAKEDNTSILLISADSNEIIPPNAQDEKSIDTTTTVEKLLVQQARSDYCKAAILNVNQSRSEFNIDKRGVFV